jgi:hypothetical protein
MLPFRARWLGLAAATAFIAAATLIPYPEQAEMSRRTPLWCLVCGELGGVDVLLNLALFVPFGVALRAAGLRGWQCIVVAFATSLGIESLQAALVTGRDPSLSDLLTNSAGGWVGSRLHDHLPIAWRPGARDASRLSAGAAGAWLLLLSATAWAVRPAPPAGALTVRWAPRVALADSFAGRLHSVRVRGADAPDGVVIPGAAERIAAGEIEIGATASLDGWTEHLAPVVDLSNQAGVAAARLGQLGQKVTFSLHANASRIRLRAPLVKVYRGLPPAAGQTVRLDGGLRGRRLWARAQAGGSAQAAALALTPGLGWLLLLPLTFYPFDYRPELTSAAWVALPLLLTGFWSGRAAAWARAAGRRRLIAHGAAATLLLVLGLEVVPAVFGVGRDGWETWLASAAALAAGWWVGRYAPGASMSAPPSARRA